MTINWSRYFDHIYCVNYLGNAKRLPGLAKEFARVGIADSGVFSFVHTSKDPWERFVAANCPRVAGEEESNRGFVNLGLATARMLREALALGYRRILVMEDDIRFLKDTEAIAHAMDAAPDWDIVQFDKFMDWSLAHDGYKAMVAQRAIEGHPGYFDGGADFLPSGACFALNRIGMEAICNRLKTKGPRPVDGIFGSVGCRRAVIDRNVAVQVAFGDALLYRYLNNGNTHHKAYAPQGLRYEDYNVPQGYGYDAICAEYEN